MNFFKVFAAQYYYIPTIYLQVQAVVYLHTSRQGTHAGLAGFGDFEVAIVT